MRRISISAVVMAAVLSVCLTGQARAEAEPMITCAALDASGFPSRGFGEAVKMEDRPTRLAWGNRAYVAFWDREEEDGFGTVVSGRQVSFEAADPDRPISHGFVRNIAGGGSFSRPGFTPVRLARGDGDARVTFRWVETHQSEENDPEWGETASCAAEFSWVIEATSGYYPILSHIRMHEDYGSHSDEVLTLVYSWQSLCGTLDDRTTAAPGELRLKVSGAGRRGQVSMLSLCQPYALKKRTSNRYWSAKVQGGNFEIRPESRRNGKQKVRFRVSLGGDLLYRGSLVFRTKIRPARRLWEGTYAFNDYCLDDYRRLRSKDGWLYCTKPAKTIRTIQKFRKKNLVG
ncbi:MAG TPA: hypothetical protein VMF31_11820 [Solirubrobacterales bacterium]|nr:hypothetical protein [Solirubrobacterales bacterium]